ncbi:MAG: putative membrane protein [Roseivirga sp.]
MKTLQRLPALISWAIIIGLSIYFFIENVAVYFTGYKSDTYINNEFWVISHLIGGTLALFLGPLQFFKWLRNKYLSFHRLSGKIYIVGAFIAGLSALRLSLISSCVSCRVSLLILAILVLFTTFSAWWTVKNKNLKAHQQFMVRSYICVLSFVAVRIGGIIPMDFLFGQIEDPTFSRTVNEYFFSFVPLICGEIFLTWLPTLKNTRNQKRPTQYT